MVRGWGYWLRLVGRMLKRLEYVRLPHNLWYGLPIPKNASSLMLMESSGLLQMQRSSV